MIAGDLIKCYNSIGLIVQSDEWETLVKWCDDGTVEDLDMYPDADIEVISEAR
jgi:hypothetical protein